ncbi:MAG: polysaccharide biosynthesis/export family protein [Magnetospirillum sp.]|nr:polysaccharide biosynthesis/export family protein [Magnetospirillum sp.]
MTTIRLGLLVPWVLTAMLSACGGGAVQNAAPIPTVRPMQQSYIIAPGDDLDVRFFYNPELNEMMTVRPDGAISMPLVGEVKAAGRTPTQLEGVLREAYGRELRQAAVTVMVKGFAGQRVYVDGEVGDPQMVNIQGNLSAMQAIASAGGFKGSARKGEVLVIRRSGAERPVVIPIDLDKALDGSDTGQDIDLAPYDIVFVPKKRIAEVNEFVDQYIRQNIPIPFGIGYGINN